MATTRGVGKSDEAVARAANALRLAVGRTARRLRQEAGEELTPSQAAVLDTIARLGPLSPSQLAAAERLTRPTTTRLIAKLKSLGLVVAFPDPADRRSYRVAISPSGAALRDVRRRRRETLLTDLLARAKPEELVLIEHSANVVLRLLDEGGR